MALTEANILPLPTVTPPIYTVDLMDVLTVTFYAPMALSIDSVSNIVNAPVTTITVAGSAYVLGTAITIGQEIVVSVDVNGVIQLITSL